MFVANTVDALRSFRGSLRGPVALVPTMGALHEGHLAHIHRAKDVAEHVVVSIFVNPTQFGAGEDFERYPRPIEEDLRLCREAGAAGVFNPHPSQLYPPGLLDCTVDVPKLTTILEGAHRPGHFVGVCRVVAKLLNLVQPDVVTFGRKDYQQLRVVEAMIRDLMLPVRILEIETLREPDGLAMSSRNRYLRGDDRKHALGLSKALRQAAMMIEENRETDPAAVERAMEEVLHAHALEVDYAVVRHPTTLQPLDIIEPALTGGVVALIAARLPSVRLIDNRLLGAPT